MDIHTLIKRFAQLEGAGVGFGPKHPVSPNLSISNEVEDFLREFSFLRQDQGYVDFLEYYAGAHYMPSDDSVTIDIFGFTDQSSHIIDLEGDIIDERGFLVFCAGNIVEHLIKGRKTRPQGFAFDATGNRMRGVYDGLEGIQYCKTFLEWLNALIENKGILT